jgi:hypothetical protein
MRDTVSNIATVIVANVHTHGGQFFPWNLVATLAQPYIEGHLADIPGNVYITVRPRHVQSDGSARIF